MRLNGRKCCGITLVELMVALAITSVLVTLAAVNFGAFMIKARRAEIKANYPAIVAMQESKFALEDDYGIANANPTDANCDANLADPGQNDLGFSIDCSRARYGYQIQRYNNPSKVTMGLTFKTFAIRSWGARNISPSGCPFGVVEEYDIIYFPPYGNIISWPESALPDPEEIHHFNRAGNPPAKSAFMCMQ